MITVNCKLKWIDFKTQIYSNLKIKNESRSKESYCLKNKNEKLKCSNLFEETKYFQMILFYFKEFKA